MNDEYLNVAREEFDSVVAIARTIYPELLITPQYATIQSEKYLFIGPRGDFYSIGRDLKPVVFGNPLEIGQYVLVRGQEYFSRT